MAEARPSSSASSAAEPRRENNSYVAIYHPSPVSKKRSMELFLEHLLGANEATEDLQKKETDKVATKSTNDSMSHGDEIDEDSFGNEEIEIVGEQWPSSGEEDEELTPSKRLPPGGEEEAVLFSIESERKRKAALVNLENQDEMNLKKALRASVKEMSTEEKELEYALSESRKQTVGRLNFGGSSSSASSSGPPPRVRGGPSWSGGGRRGPSPYKESQTAAVIAVEDDSQDSDVQRRRS